MVMFMIVFMAYAQVAYLVFGPFVSNCIFRDIILRVESAL